MYVFFSSSLNFINFSTSRLVFILRTFKCISFQKALVFKNCFAILILHLRKSKQKEIAIFVHECLYICYFFFFLILYCNLCIVQLCKTASSVDCLQHNYTFVHNILFGSMATTQSICQQHVFFFCRAFFITAMALEQHHN